ncbi:2-dehydro-3-deoxy-6-phosphogalactonate aldolase [Pseudoxanthomonas broegbernensis]|uniref:2-dehydro-3-deoxy-6-phosphogalactonate aldolase n=2 Tax=Pseudoxanthomonas broegbernensis TaxID=83619 RepID=A0A7V8K6Z0_9GAMM|nr:2-dehydro-3-deoxy-6-phosphogalactonate aldolase [Pseudoxanthomonas broegbernensis]KAF1685924.1 2-dehydro-3-deoxy-6-phosphogalactonate aldolase [Pseudoxanthomonas broegbernensis]MBB6064154.1 2-dehydro-3-deoxyphosphogalactonate aldolase [Pseudoxanthomonas broegbernensis]
MTDSHRSPFRLPLIAILRGIVPGEAVDHVGELVAEGYDAIEIPLNSPDWEDSIGRAAQAHGAAAWIGGGTVLRPAQVDTLQRLGARFIVTPNTNPTLIRHAVAAGMQVVAGFATASEAFAALEAGAQMLKLFPAATYGTGHVRALRAVLPKQIPLYVVGGVTPRSLPAWLASGADGAGIGGELYRPGQSPDTTHVHARAFRQALAGPPA